MPYVFPTVHKLTQVTTVMPDTPLTEHKYTTFYQICQIRNPFTKKYETRKTVFDKGGKIVKYFENEYCSKDIKKFMQVAKPNKYRIYSVQNISMIGLPGGGDMMMASSELTNGGAERYGPASF